MDERSQVGTSTATATNPLNRILIVPNSKNRPDQIAKKRIRLAWCTLQI